VHRNKNLPHVFQEREGAVGDVGDVGVTSGWHHHSCISREGGMWCWCWCHLLELGSSGYLASYGT
jgi:hypothetical protein